MVLTFTCNNCQALLTKSKIMKHHCPVINTTNGINNVTDDQSNKSVVSNKRFTLVAMTFSNQQWNDFVATSLIQHETNDDNLRLVLSGLRFRKNFPRKEKKFYNYINAFLPSKSVPDCAKIIWDIVIKKLKELTKDTSLLTKTETVLETESISLQKRKLDTDNLVMELNNDVSEEKKTKLSDSNTILPNNTVPTEIEQIETSNTISELEENTNNLSENISLQNTDTPELDKLTPDINENPIPDQNILEKVVQPDVIVESIDKKVVPNSNKSLNRNLLWKAKAIERLSSYKTEDENMKTVINALKYKRFLPQKEDKFIKLMSTIPKTRKINDCCKIIWGIINGQETETIVENIPQQTPIEISNPELDNEFLDLLKVNGSLESLNSQNVNVKLISENKEETKSLTVEPVSQNENLPESINVKPVVNIVPPTKLINSDNEIQENRPTKFRHFLTTAEWHEKVMEALNKYRTSDTDLLILIARLKTRNNIPQKFFKFKNFIHNIPLSHKIANCADLLWDIILPGNLDTSKNNMDALSSGMPILKSVESIKHD